MQYWIRETGYRMIVLFEGRDAAGKGCTIKRLTPPLKLRGCRLVALRTPTERKKASCISTSISNNSRLLARLLCSIEAGTNERVWSGSWGSAALNKLNSFLMMLLNLKRC